MDGIIFRFVELMVILAVYENTNEDGPPTQVDLLGSPPKWKGLVNELMYDIYLLDKEGESNDIAYGKKLKSGNTLLRGIKKMRDCGIMIPSEDESRTAYELTPLGKKIGAYLSRFAHYTDMPKACLVNKDGEIAYGG